MYAKKATVTMFNKEVEVYQLPDGSYTMSKTQVGQVLQKHDKSLREWLEGKSPEALPYKNVALEVINIEGTQLLIHSVPLSLAYSYWLYWANKGCELAQELITEIGKMSTEEGVATFGENFKHHIHYCKKSKIKIKKPEKEIQEKLNLKLKGLLEVATPVGKIDILTDTLLIEIKKAKDWKTAIGQLLMYGHYYPKHQKILYLFDLSESFDIDLVSYLCSDFNIDVVLNSSCFDNDKIKAV